MQPEAGLLVTPSLRLVRPLQKGGMGSVWVAEHVGLETQVAVKFIATDIVRSKPTLVARFKREAAVAAKLKSPHVVQMLDHGLTADGTPYIAMELMTGESLDARVSRGPLDVRQVGLVVAQVAQVLGQAHALGIVHRDIKPANVFLIQSAYDIFCKVLDFGIAKQTDELQAVAVTSTGAFMGSPLFMSPEQFSSAKEVDGRADLWSLAVVAFEALTGHPPFLGESIGQVMMAVMKREFRPASQLRPELAGGIDAFFAKAFAESIDQRFQSAQEIADSFLAAAASMEAAAIAPLPVVTPAAGAASSSGSTPWSPAIASPVTSPLEASATATSPSFAGAGAPVGVGTAPTGTFAPASHTFGPTLTASAPRRSMFVLVGGLVVAGVVAGFFGIAALAGASNADTEGAPALATEPHGEELPSQGDSQSAEQAAERGPEPSASGVAHASASSGAAAPSVPADDAGAGPSPRTADVPGAGPSQSAASPQASPPPDVRRPKAGRPDDTIGF